MIQYCRCANLSHKLKTTREKNVLNKNKNKANNVQLFKDMRSRLGNEAARSKEKLMVWK